MTEVRLPEGMNEKGLITIKNLESGDVFATDVDGAIEFFILVDVDHETSSELAVNLRDGRVNEFQDGLYVTRCPGAAIRAILADRPEIPKTKSSRNPYNVKICGPAPDKRPTRLIDLPAGGVFAFSDSLRRKPMSDISLYLKTDEQRYEMPDGNALRVTCVDLSCGTTFEIDAHRDDIKACAEIEIYPYGTSQDKKEDD